MAKKKKARAHILTANELGEDTVEELEELKRLRYASNNNFLEAISSGAIAIAIYATPELEELRLWFALPFNVHAMSKIFKGFRRIDEQAVENHLSRLSEILAKDETARKKIMENYNAGRRMIFFRTPTIGLPSIHFFHPENPPNHLKSLFLGDAYELKPPEIWHEKYDAKPQKKIIRPH